MLRIVGLLLAISVASRGFAAGFPAPYNSGSHDVPPPVAADAAARTLRLPAGFKASVFAAEPDVQNPIAMAWDPRGRLWIAENYTYAERTLKFDTKLHDRVLIFEDRNGDGRFSSRRVFADDFQRLTSVEIGRGGVWLMCPPQLLFVPDRDEDGVPDGLPEVVLDGFTVPAENYHNFANGLRFGPDGWLYGRCGASSPGELGVPGTPREQRVPLRGTMWRYHPQRKVVEVLGGGATNPWGHDWDQHGELFFINTVNGHLWHGITGAHYVRAHTLDPAPFSYALIDMHADHWHFDSAQDWTKSRDGAANAYGGGHAHAGLMIYQGDNWPAEYRGRLFTLNFHGRRLNQETLERDGTGYVARHASDLFVSDDPWFRGIDVGSGPDGGVFVLDWSDMGECHNSTGVNRGSGRIFKITHGEPRRNRPADLSQVGGRDLVALLAHENVWQANYARRELVDRAARGHKLTHGLEDLRALFEKAPNPVIALRALWTLHSLGAASPEFLRAQLRHSDEHVRTWAVRLLTETWTLDTVLGTRMRHADVAFDDHGLLNEFVRMAGSETSGLVRLALATVLQRVPPAKRFALATALARRTEDVRDHNQPLMVWYGLIPLGDSDPVALARFAATCELPTTRKLVARRLAEALEQSPAALNELIGVAREKTDAYIADVLAGMSEGLNGWRRAPKPAAWDALVTRVEGQGNAELQTRLRDLNVVFGDGRALEDVKALVLNGKADMTARRAALRSLIDARPADLRQICEQVLRVRFLNTVAIRGLALFDDPAVGDRVAGAYTSFHPSERNAVIEMLVTRPAFARALLAQIPAGRVSRTDISPYHARQIRSFNDPELNRQLAATWGEFREPATDKHALMVKLKAELTPQALAVANKSQGRVVFAASCGACHTLYGQGGAVGPDLTGAGRDNIDYLIENIVDPGAVVTADYRVCIVKLKDGRTLNGFISARTARTLTIKSMTDSHTVERGDIGGMEELPQSMMPDGLLEALTMEQRRDLIAYLLHPSQVGLP